jgi:hypothetical protein
VTCRVVKSFCMGFKQRLGIVLGLASVMIFRVADLHAHSEKAAVRANKDTPMSSCRAIAPIEILVEDSLQSDLAETEAVVWQPLWSR